MFPVYNLRVVDEPGPAFGSIEYVSSKPILDNQFYENLNYDEEVNRLLDQVEEEFLRDKPKNYDFPEDTHHVGSIPDWYRDMLKNKIKEAKSRLEKLSDLVCTASPSTAAHIKRIEEDHSTAFCKMDYPRHPPMHKSWRSTWEFCYARKCKKTDSTNHVHMDDCKSLVVEDSETGVCVNSQNVSQHDYPQHVICVARLFQKFARNYNKKINKSKVKKKSECEEKSECKEKPESIDKTKSTGIQNVDTREDDWWTTMSMVLISNHLNELMIVVRREDIKSFIPHLKTYFRNVIRSHPNIVSVFGFPNANMNAKTKQWLKTIFKRDQHVEELLIAGIPALRDQIGPLVMEHDLNNRGVFFDSVQTMQLGKVIQDYMCLTKETTLLEIGCNFGVLSLILGQKCEKVVKFIAEPYAHWLIKDLEKWKIANEIHNVLFAQFIKANIIPTCARLIKQCITVAIVKLNSMAIRRGRLKNVMQALRNLPSIWRVILYGSFTDPFHESIAVLMSEDDSMGERYLPMQGCILDKSPTVVNAFDLVILFERKSLIAPKVKLFAPGPTVNVAVDPDTSDDDSMDAQEWSLDRDRELANSNEKCEERLPLSTNDQHVPSLSEIIELRFDHPPPPLGILPPFSHPPPPVHPNPSDQVREDCQNDYPLLDSRFPNHRFHPEPYPPMRDDFQNDYPPSFFHSRFPNPQLHPEPYPPVREDLQFDFPLPLFERYSNGHQGPHAPVRDDFQDHYYPPLPPENYYNPPHHLEPYPVVNIGFQNQYQLAHLPPPLPPPLPPVLPENKKSSQPKKVKPQFFYPPPPPTRFPSPPPPPLLPPPEETDLLEKESNTSSVSMTVIDEPPRVCGEGKIGEVVHTAEDVISSFVIKSEPVDTLSDASCYSTTTTVKTKPLQDEVKKESNVANCGTTVKTESLQDDEKKESNEADSGTSSSVTRKSEPVNESSSVRFSETNCQNIPLPVTVESKSTAYSPNRSPDCEPMDMQISPNPPDFHSMETPIHNPRALSDITAPSVSNNVSVSDSEFPLQTNQSFLRKAKPINDDREPGEISDSDEENEAIGEEKNKQQMKSETIEVASETSRKHARTAPIVSRKLNRPPRPFPGKYSESSCKRRKRGRSPSPKRMRRSPTPNKRRRRSPKPDERRGRSPLRDRRRERSRRSPPREAHGRARSPRDRRSRRSRSPRRR